MRRPSKFKKTDVTRAAKVVLAAGLEIARIEVAEDGSIIVVPGKTQETTPATNGGRNEWDDAA